MIRSTRRRLGFVLIALMVAVSALTATTYTVWRMQAETIKQQLSSTALTARALEEHLTQSLDVIDAILMNVPVGREASVSFAAMLRNTPYLRSIAVLDGAGTITASSSAQNRGIKLARADFYPSVAEPVDLLRAGSLWDGRDFHDAHPADPESAAPAVSFIPVARDLHLTGERRAAVVAAINTDYFLNYYGSHIAAGEDVVQLLRYDGQLLLSTDERHRPGVFPGNEQVLARMAKTEANHFEEKSGDGESMLTAYRVSSTYPFVLVVRLNKDRALAGWRQEAIYTFGIVGITLLAALAIASLYFVRFERAARAQEQNQEQLRIASIAFESQEGIVVTDACAIVLRVNKAFTAITGFEPADVVGQHMSFLKSGKHDASFYAAIWASVQGCGSYAGEVLNRHKDGSIHPHWIGITAVYGDDGDISHYVGTLTDITERKQAEDSLLTLSRAIEQSPACILITDTDANIEYVNPRFREVTGYEFSEVRGRNPRILSSREKSAAEYQAMWAMLTAGKTWHGEFHNRKKDGSLFWERASISPVYNDAGSLIHYVAVKEDITEIKAANEKLQLAASVFLHAREGIMIADLDGTIIDVNDAFTRITGYSRQEILGQNPRILNSGRQDKSYFVELWRSLTEQGYWYGEVWNRRKNGEVYAEMQTISTVRDTEGKPKQYVSLFSDITPLKEHQQKLEHIAHYDALTNLPNRVLLADRLRQAMVQAERRGQILAVVYLDLDGFKAVNDSHGHEAGDHLLMALGPRMTQALREGDTLARLGGDEFVAVLIDLNDGADCLPVLNRLLAAVAQPVHLNNAVLQVSGSVGVSFYPQNAETEAEQLLRQADQAMYQAKLAGRNRFHIFDAEHDQNIRGHHESIEHIRQALLGKQFVLHYQPKVNMRTGAVVGVEALIRWQHPEQGMLPPAVFLPVIESHPLAIEIGEWVIDTALAQIENWRALGLDIPVSVNIGAQQLQKEDFIQRLHHIMAKHPQVSAGSLELEVLETNALEDLAHVSQVIEACREIGVDFSLDDFGTGYSSLSYLKHLSVNQLKIDQSFVHDMLDDPDDLAILDGVLGLAGAFRREVIAEGVETVGHGQMLLQLGCELAQGYGIAHPMPADAIPAWAAAWHPDVSWRDCPTVSRDDVPLIFAGVELRFWVSAISNFLEGKSQTAPEHDPAQCQFGQWLDNGGRARYQSEPAFHPVEKLHHQVHLLGAELCELQESGQCADDQEKLPQLYLVRDELLGCLKILLDEKHRHLANGGRA